MTPTECEECGERPATATIQLNGVPTAMCDPCLNWWAHHGPPPERVVERISEVELVGTFDARVWAEQFVDRFKGSRIGPGDVSEETMIGWFANAIMAGYDERARRVSDGREQG